jgi:hypothetical protein
MKRIIFVPIIVLLLVSSCGYYSVSGSLPSHIKTCAVPLFENETVEAGIVEEITTQVSNAIIKDGNMKVVGEFQADAVVRGTIVDVIDEAESYSKETSAEQFRIRIIASVTFFDRRKNRALWEEKRMEGEAAYAAGDLSARDDAIKEAMELLAKEIIDKTVSGW